MSIPRAVRSAVEIDAAVTPCPLPDAQGSDIGRHVHSPAGEASNALGRKHAQAFRRVDAHMSGTSPPAIYDARSAQTSRGVNIELQVPGTQVRPDGQALHVAAPGLHPPWPALVGVTAHA